MKKTKGFTLIELMIVVAIIGILAAIAIPKFADLIRKANEGATKGGLATLRSALSIYYSDNEGVFPVAATGVAATQNLGVMTIDGKYLDDFPWCNQANNTLSHPKTKAVTPYGTLALLNAGDVGSWGYIGQENALNAGKMAVDCTHSDTRNTVWNTY